MSDAFVSQQYEVDEEEEPSDILGEEDQEQATDNFTAVEYDDNGQYYDENGYLCDAYGYYDEYGTYHEYESKDVQEILHNDSKLLVDKHGRILSEQRIAEADPNLPEEYDVFVSVFQPQRLASVLDADAASLCVWYVLYGEVT